MGLNPVAVTQNLQAVKSKKYDDDDDGDDDDDDNDGNLFPAGTIARDPHHRESPTSRKQGLFPRRT